VTDRIGVETIVPCGEIWHLRGLSSDGLMGMSPIDLARESLGVALATPGYGARFFANDAKPTGGWIEFPGSFKDSEAKKVFRESYQAAQSGANSGKVLVLGSAARPPGSTSRRVARSARSASGRPISTTRGRLPLKASCRR